MLRLKAERLKRRWSQTTVSIRTGGIAASDISAVESGKRYPHAGWRRRLAIAFGIPEADLFAEVPDQEPEPVEVRTRR